MIKLWFEMFWINIGYSPPLSWKMGSHCLMSICMQSIWILPRSSLCPRSCLRLLLSAVSGRMHVLALNKKWNMKWQPPKGGGGRRGEYLSWIYDACIWRKIESFLLQVLLVKFCFCIYLGLCIQTLSITV